MILLLLLKTALYGVDVYTCIKLLAFDEWSSMVKPYLSFKISKWLFAACIICSVVLLGFDLIRGIRVFRTRNISLIYTNSFARTVKSLCGYGYFCLLDAINPSSGFDKMAFYTWFTLDGSKKLILADSPRQVINALTLYSVLNVADGGFWETLKTISTTNRAEAVILYSMSISFFIWIFFITGLFFALSFFCFPVYITIKRDGFQGLRQYVCIKVDSTVKKLARKYSQKRLLKEHRKRLARKATFDEEKGNIPEIELPPLTPDVGRLEPIPKSFTMDSMATASSDSTTVTDPFQETPQYIKPAHCNESQVSMLKYHDNIPAQQYSVYEGRIPPLGEQPYQNNDSMWSNSGTKLGSTSKLNKSEPQQSLIRPLRKAPTDSSMSFVAGEAPFDTTQLSQRKVFMDQEKLAGGAPSTIELGDDDDLDEDYLEQYDNDDSYLEIGDMMTRNDVRPSMVMRAKDMEDEDYSRFVTVSGDAKDHRPRRVLR